MPTYITCKNCGKVFGVWPSKAKAHNIRFCSRQCKKTWTATRPTRWCSRCKSEKSRVEFDSTHNYCRDCYRSYSQERSGTPARRWTHARSKAKQCNHEWALTFDEYSSLILLSCHYCGQPLERSGIGLDRKDSNGGYTLSNVVPCCFRCNKVKMDHFTYDQMLRLAVVIRQLDAEMGDGRASTTRKYEPPSDDFRDKRAAGLRARPTFV